MHMPSPAPKQALLLFDRLRKTPDILAAVERADDVLGTLNYTDHGRRHVTLVGINAARVLGELQHEPHAADLAAVAGLLHDIGNVKGREGHAAAGADMAYDLLRAHGVHDDDANVVRIAILNHDETEGGIPSNVPGAALIVADKADIHRSRVRTRNPADFDIHDRVNFAVVRSELQVDADAKGIGLSLEIDGSVAHGDEVAALFADRFALADAAARYLGCTFRVTMNGASAH